MTAEKPWIIITLRRTGGTSLTTFLSRVSAFPTIEHEPLNNNRKLGHITRDFRKTRDEGAAAAQLAQALEQRPNIKHCVEVVPPEITRALIDAAASAGYTFLVLTRRNEARRLASLLLAMSTGAWGREMANEVYPKIISGEVVPEPIDLGGLKKLVNQNAVALARSLIWLRNRGVSYEWLLFEDIYQGDVSADLFAVDLARRMNIPVDQLDPEIAKLFTSSGQRSIDIAAYVENYDEAVEQLTKLCLQ